MILATPPRLALFGTLVLLGFTSPAFAQSGINLSWDDCGGFGLASKSFACDTNAGQDVLFGSAVSGVDLDIFAVEATITVAFDGPTLSGWWRLDTTTIGPAGCRKGAFTASSDFTAGPHHCADPWGPGAIASQAYDLPGYPNQGRMRAIGITPDQSTRHIDGAVEYEYFKIVLTHAKTIGTGSCAGCSGGATLYLMSVRLDQLPEVGDYTFRQPLERAYVTWQGGTPVAARKSTWGAVKSLYR